MTRPIPHRDPGASSTPLVLTRGLTLFSDEGRALVSGLDLKLGPEKTALIGRNGCGKSTLMQVLAGQREPHAGTIENTCSVALVAQELARGISSDVSRLEQIAVQGDSRAASITRELIALGLPAPEDLRLASRLSRGQARKLALLAAMHSGSALLLLDEPTQDLDQAGVAWLHEYLDSWQGGLLVVSHDARLLRSFRHFFMLAESGCRYFSGSYADLEDSAQRQARDDQERYLRHLNSLARREEHNAILGRRRRRKKMGGRVREIDRAPSRALLNSKRSYAQESQGKRAKMQEARIESTRAWTRATRRALQVDLALTALVPPPPPDDGQNNLELVSVTRERGDLILGPMSLVLRRERIALRGPNGSGKTSLLALMLGHDQPSSGRVYRRSSRIGSIAQGGGDWLLDESLLSVLLRTSEHASLEHVAQRLAQHKFPLALADRALQSLSPGERVRAALLCLFERSPAVELLILDEPTYSLDIVGKSALGRVLRAWRGGLIVASHDLDFLNSIGIHEEIVLSRHA